MSRSLQLMAGRKTDVRDAEWVAQLLAGLCSQQGAHDGPGCSGQCDANVSVGSDAMMVALRGAGETTASSPKDSPEPMIRNVANATDGVSAG